MSLPSQSNRDRTVHATNYFGASVVRYDRSGKWYLEEIAGPYKSRTHITLATAVREALLGAEDGRRVKFGRSGGRSFDAAVRKAMKAEAKAA